MDSPLARRRVPLQALLAGLVLAAVLPIAGMLSWQVHDGMRAERARAEVELVRAAAGFAQAADSELASSVAALRVLAQSELFQQGRIAAMGRLLHGRPRRDWDSIFVLDPQGNVVLDTAQRTSPPAAFRAMHHETVTRLAPVVSGLAGAGMAIAVPVMQQDQLRYVLGVRVAGSQWQRLAAQAALPEGAQARLYDRDGRLISQSGGAAPDGAQLAPEALQPMQRRNSGVQRASEPGGDVYAAWDRVPLAHWHARVSIPAQPIDAAQRQLMLDALTTSGLALLAGLLLAAAVADAILRRARELETQVPPPAPGGFAAMLTQEVPKDRSLRSATGSPGHGARAGRHR